MQEYWTKHKPIYKLRSIDHYASLKSFYHKKNMYHMTNIYCISNTLSQKIFEEIFSIP